MIDLDTIATSAVVALRWAALAIALPVLVASFPGFLAFARRPGIASGFRSLAFLIAATAISFQSGYLIEGIPLPPARPRTMLSLALLLCALFLAAGGLVVFRNVRSRGFGDLFEAIEVTGPIAELWRRDPEAARRLGDEAKRLTIDRILDKS